MEYFSEIILQKQIKDFFTRSIENDRLAHAYLFYGGEGHGKEAFALSLAKALNCQSDATRPCNKCANCQRISHFNHPDVRFIFPVSKQLKPEQIKNIVQAKVKNPYAALPIPGSKNISIDAIRDLKSEAKYGAFENGYRVVIISGAEYMSREAANSFLKLLEEPPERFLIILITESLHAIIDTIRSRCQPVYFPEFEDEQIERIVATYEPVETDIKPLIRLARHNVKKVFAMLHASYAEQKEWVLEFLRAIARENYFRINELIEQIRKESQDYVLELLSILTGWFQDALHLRIALPESQLVHYDQLNTLKNFTDSYPDLQVDSIIQSIENACNAIESNAHPVLTLFNLAIELHDLFGPRKALKEAT